MGTTVREKTNKPLPLRFGGRTMLSWQRRCHRCASRCYRLFRTR